MKMNFKRNDDTGDVTEVTLVLSWDEFNFIATAFEVFDKVLEVDYFTDIGPNERERQRIIQQFDNLDGDGEDASPIDVEAHDPITEKMALAWNKRVDQMENPLSYEDLWNPDDEDRISRSEYLKALQKSVQENQFDD